MSEDKTAKDIAKLRHDVDILKLRIKDRASEKTIYKKDFSQHIEELDKSIKKRESQSKIKITNLFAIGQQVKVSNNIISFHAIAPGTIKFIACKAATPSVKTCDKNNCAHNNKDYVWVQWASGKTYSYHFSHLQLITENDLKPHIGKDISGRIGEWTFDADKKTWKRDGSDKEYTSEEFEDVVYFETHPYAKEDGEDFIKALKLEQEAHKTIESIK